MSRHIADKLRKLVAERAKNCCEYCLFPQLNRLIKHHIEHILPVQHDGLTEEDNLALACPRCNNFKGTNIAGYDLETGNLTSLFNPRTQMWTEHFQIEESGGIIPLTAEARVTVRISRFNDAKGIE